MFEDGRFDLVTSMYALSSYTSPRASGKWIEECARVTKEGGQIKNLIGDLHGIAGRQEIL